MKVGFIPHTGRRLGAHICFCFAAGIHRQLSAEAATIIEEVGSPKTAHAVSEESREYLHARVVVVVFFINLY